MKDIVDEDIEQLLDAIIHALPKALSYVFGKKIDVNPNMTTKEKKEYVKLVRKSILLLHKNQAQIEQMKIEGINPKEILLVYLRSMNEVQHLIVPEMPESQHFVYFYIEYFTKILKEPLESSFIKLTGYQHYKDSIKELIIRMINLKQGPKIGQFLDQIEKSEDLIIFTQAVFTRLADDYHFLDKNRVRITRKTIVRHIKIYGELAGHFEKFIVGVLGLIEIYRNNQIPDYSELRRGNLSSNYWALRHNSDYSGLVAGFNPVIRNSIAHVSYTFLPSEKKIRFKDRQQTIDMTYEEFDKQVKELSALVLALSQIKTIFLVITYHALKQVLEQKEKVC